MTKQHDAHVRARLRIITRVVDRRIAWTAVRFKGESFEDMHVRLRSSAAESLAAYQWREGWGMVAEGTYSFFGGKQKLRMAKNIPEQVIHDIMCTRA